MRVLKIVAVAAISLFAATAVATAQDKGGAAGALPLVTTLPPASPKHDEQQILFGLKANGISQEITPQEFCKKLDYGDAVLSGPPVPEIKDNKVVSVISWVICRFDNTPK